MKARNFYILIIHTFVCTVKVKVSYSQVFMLYITLPIHLLARHGI